MRFPLLASILLFSSIHASKQQQDQNECIMDAETGVCQESIVQDETDDTAATVAAGELGLHDNNPMCSHWAQLGECDTNPK